MTSENLLMAKTNQELREMCTYRGITGMSKQPKATLISVLLNDMADKSEIPYSRSDLEAKSVTELRALCEDRGMTGLGRQIKATLVEVLINDYTREVLSQVTAEVTVTRNDDDSVTSTAKVSCGALTRNFEVVGHTISEVVVLLKEALNIPSNPLVNVNGTNIDNMDYVVEEDDVIEFVQKAETKGQN